MNFSKTLFYNLLAAFTCQQPGIFANTDFNDCKTYVICNSNLSPTVYNCYDDTYFWPEKQGCFSQYSCASNSAPGNTNPCEGYDYADLLDSSDCSKYILCRTTYHTFAFDNIRVQQELSKQCPSGTVYRPGYECVNDQDHRCVDYQCTSEGIFENPNDCSTFIKCWKYSASGVTGLVTLFFPDLNNCPGKTK